MKTGKDGISDIISVFNMYEQKMYHIAYMGGGCGAAQTEIMLLFNRLIDPSKIEYVEVNGLIYNVSE